MKEFILRAWCCLLLVGNLCSSSFALEPANLKGNLFFRTQAGREFNRVKSEFQLKEPALISAPPDSLFPLATGSTIEIASFSLTVFPGSTLKVAGRNLNLLKGRIKITGDNPESSSLRIGDAKFSAEIYHGDFLLEVTPEDDFWMAMSKKGEAWLKDRSRRVVEFQPGSEVHIPLFGKTIVKERLSSRWEKAPEVSVIDNVAAVFSPEPADKGAASQPEQLQDDNAEALQEADDDENSVPNASASEDLSGVNSKKNTEEEPQDISEEEDSETD